MMFSITSKESTQDIEAALAAEFHGLVASGSVQSKYTSLINDSSTSFRVVTVGGSAANAEALINTGDPSKFFDSNPAISTGVPISYVVRNLSDNSVAGVSETTSYTVKTCEATAKTGANYYVLDAHARKVLAFDSSGNAVELAHPILLDTALFPNNSDIAYDPNDDRLLLRDNQLLNAYTSDGLPTEGGNEVPASSQSVSFDAKHGQTYVTGPAEVAVLTSTGEPVVQDPVDCTIQTLYVPSQDELFCLYGADGIGAYSFGLYDSITLPDNAFAAVYDADQTFTNGEYAVYDAFNDRILIGFNTDVWSFTPLGKLVTHFPLKGHLKGLARDSVSHRVATVLDNGTVQLFQDDATPVPLADGAFPGIADARGMVFRP
jgi:Thiol-activated cytolysin